MSCTYYRWNGGVFGDYWCDKKNERVNSDIYYKYCRDYSYGDCPIYKQNNSSSGCFITTITCNILGKEDNCKVLNNIRFLREDVIKKEKKYEEILMDYDYIGPLIACSIEHDSEKKEIATMLYDKVLSKVSALIEKKEYEFAIEIYQKMVLSLIDYYGLKEFYEHYKNNCYDVNTFDIEKSGHGRVLKREYNLKTVEAQ